MKLNDEQKIFLDMKLAKLRQSKFRNSFYLKRKDKEYVISKGIDVIEKHANDLIEKRLVPEFIENDGRQTPMKGHPVFIAQHATGCCCRGCLEKWHNIPSGRKLTDKEKRFVVSLLMYWIEKQME